MAGNWQISQTIDLQRGAPEQSQLYPRALMLRGDNKAHTWQVTVLDAGAPAPLTGATVVGYFARPDGNTVVVPGTVDGNVARVTLAQSCYATPGLLQCVMRMTRSGATVSLSHMQLMVADPLTDTVIDPGNVIPSLSDLLAQIAHMEAGTTAANLAATRADTARVELVDTIDQTMAAHANWRRATGNPASCYPVPGSPLYPEIDLIATQAGAGDPSPDNVRPIVPSVPADGKVKARRTGRNLLKLRSITTESSNGVTFVVTGDGGVTMTGTATGSATCIMAGGGGASATPIIRMYAGKRYVISRPKTSPANRAWILLYGRKAREGSWTPNLALTPVGSTHFEVTPDADWEISKPRGSPRWTSCALWRLALLIRKSKRHRAWWQTSPHGRTSWSNPGRASLARQQGEGL